MLKVENVKVYNFENAIIGMRHPLESHYKSDTVFREEGDLDLGNNDKELMQKLILAGSDHRKFMRQILVSFDVSAPLYWFKEFDTYKVATVANSTSTMHTIHKKGINEDLFSMEDIWEACDNPKEAEAIESYLNLMEAFRCRFENSKDKKYWRGLIQGLPSSFNQTRMITLNYETLRNIYFSRRNHKLSEWRVDFIKFIESLPYAKELIMLEK